MDIYHKQCGIIQKFDEKAQTGKFTVLLCEIRFALLKTWKTIETKSRITQNFQILYPIQGDSHSS